MGTLPPWPSTITLVPLKGGVNSVRHDSAAECADGRVIYVWTSDDWSTVYYSHYLSPNNFLLADNASATAGVSLASTLGFSQPQATVWRHPTSGQLFLLASGFDGTNDWTRVWRSPSGNGESAPGVPDWVLHGTIQGPVAMNGFDKDVRERCMGVPYVTGSGRWVVTAVEWQEWQGAWTSDDNGVTWTFRHRLRFYMFGGAYGYGIVRNVVSYAGKLWISASGNVEPAEGAYSSDGGTTWTSFDWPGTDNSDLAQIITADAGGIYTVFGGVFYGSPAGLEQSIDPPVTPRGTRPMVVPNFPGSLKAVLQQVGGHDVYMIDGQILYAAGGWSVGQVRIA